MLLASGWALRSQIGAVLAVTTHGEVPDRVTFSPVWWPERLRAMFPGAAGGEGGYASVLDHAPGASESMLGPEVEVEAASEPEVADVGALRVVTDGNGVAAAAHPALAASGEAK